MINLPAVSCVKNMKNNYEKIICELFRLKKIYENILNLQYCNHEKIFCIYLILNLDFWLLQIFPQFLRSFLNYCVI